MIKVAKIALIQMVASCVETYPKEIMGILLLSKKKQNKVEGALPYTEAKHTGYFEVNHTGKTRKVRAWIKTQFNIMDGFHSHPTIKGKGLDCTPSEEDLKQLEVGQYEIIIALRKLKRKTNIELKKQGKGLKGSINGYRFLIKCWLKISSENCREINITKY